MNNLCTFSHVFFKYHDKKYILKDLNFSLKKGECLAILGSSGSGRSTLGALLAHQLAPSSGQILWPEGFFQFPKTLSCYGKLQRVFQDPSSALTPFYTPYRTLEEVLKLHQVLDPLQRKEKIEELLNEVELSPVVFHQKNKYLSGGEKQRLVLARALCLNPEVLILDEPTSSCDLSTQASILIHLKKRIEKTGMSVVIILHSFAQAAFLADRLCILHHGVIEEIGSTQEILTSPASSYTQMLLAAEKRHDVNARLQC